MTGTILALDIGDKRVGVAGSDALNITAQPLTTLVYTDKKTRERVFAELATFIEQRNATIVVAGLPVNMNGTESAQTDKVRRFVADWQSALKRSGLDPADIQWVFWDERWSTLGAEKELIRADTSRTKRKGVIDKMAAVFLLQGYMASLENLS